MHIDQLTYENILHTLKDEASAISFAQDQGLILCRRTCVCGNQMKVRHKQT
jgi:hypothetical protein